MQFPLQSTTSEPGVEAVVLLQENGQICGFSESARVLLGWRLEEVIGQQWADLLKPSLLENSPLWDAEVDTSEVLSNPHWWQRVGSQQVSIFDSHQQALQVELSVLLFASEGTLPAHAGSQWVLLLRLIPDTRTLSPDRVPVIESAPTPSVPSAAPAVRVSPVAHLQATRRDQIQSDASAKEVMQYFLRLICEELGWTCAHGLLVDEVGDQLRSCGAWGATEEILQKELQQSDLQTEFALGEDLPGQTWETGCELWCRSDQNWLRLKSLQAAGFDVQTGLALPVLIDGQVTAVLEFFHRELIPPHPLHVQAIREKTEGMSTFLERRRWQRERSFLSRVFESSVDAVIRKDRNATIISWNDGARRIYGYTAQEAIGQPISLILPEGQEVEEPEILAAIQTQQTLASFETVRRNKSNELIDVSLTISPILDPDGVVVGSATIARDITQLKANIRDLHDREEKLRLLMDASGEAIYGVDLEGRCIFANRACANILGFGSDSELQQQEMHQLIHHSRRDGSPYPREECPIHQTIKTGKSRHIANEVYWKQTGESFPVEYWCSPIRRNHEIVGAVVVFEDASERIQADRTRAELAAIVESSRDAIIGKALNGTIKSWNRGAEKLYGYEAHEAIGRNYVELLCDPEKSEPTTSGRQTGTQSIFEQVEVFRRHKTGHTIVVGITESAIRNWQGEVIGTASIERDITISKRREAELEEARRAAEVANQAKSEFLANISHELRTPMNGVLGMLRIALEEPLPGALRDYLSTACDSAETLLFLLDDLLDFSRMESGLFELDPEPFSLRDTIDAAIKTLALRAYEKGLELGVHIGSAVPDKLLGDAYRFRQVVTNLVGNAIKFTDQGEIVVSIASEPDQESAVRLMCAVKDTGVGIPAENLENIFEPFTQVDSSSTRARTGSGLGLAICRKLTAKMGGDISVSSELNQGTTFHFSALFELIGGEEVTPETTQLEGMRALIVDDNQTNLSILTDLLSDWSIEPIRASSAREALQLVQELGKSEESLSVAIIDSLMPEVNGLTLIRELQNSNSDLPVILMVAPGERLAFEKRRDELAISALLEKPVSRSDVLDAVMTVLKGPHLSWQSYEDVRPVARQRLRLLVVEDTPANQKVVCAILEKRGHTVTLAHNGREALTKLQEEAFDSVLMDIQMPVMDGLQATAAIRQLEPPLAGIPIIAMTAHARREDRQRCLEAGMNAYISKPIDAQKLIGLVERIGSRTKKNSQRETRETFTAGPPPERENSPKLLNIEVALQRMGGDREILMELARAFREDAPNLMQEITTAQQNVNWKSLHRAAHSLKGLAANFEARPLANAAERLEQAAKAQNLEQLPEKIRQIQKDLSHMLKALESEVQNG